ncbi:MAG: ATP-dependent Clp protease proteolytic subunit [Erysipelotrichales bacterium]|nr:ATP-dependent Clp protease proteolytic subunit [Erysipelotrichales bacterium]
MIKNNMNKDERFSIDYSLKRNTINIFGVIDTNMAEHVINQLQYLDYKFKEDDVPEEDRIITIQINSMGGSVSDGFAIYDTMTYIDAKIRTVGLGMVASMAAFLLSSGTKGLRYATENCEILIHQPLGGASGQASDIIIAANHIAQLRTRINKILALNTNQSLKTIIKDTERDTILIANDAKKYGLIDEVITNKIVKGE